MSMFGYLLLGIGFVLLLGVVMTLIKAGRSVAHAVVVSAHHIDEQATLNAIKGSIEVAKEVSAISNGTTQDVFEYYRILQKELRSKGRLPSTSTSISTSTSKPSSSSSKANKSPDFKRIEC